MARHSTIPELVRRLNSLVERGLYTPHEAMEIKATVFNARKPRPKRNNKPKRRYW